MSSIVQRNAMRSRRNHRLRLMAGRVPMIPVVHEPQIIDAVVAMLRRPRRLILPSPAMFDPQNPDLTPGDLAALSREWSPDEVTGQIVPRPVTPVQFSDLRKGS